MIYVSILMEFFAYALEPEQLDFLGGVVTDIHTRIKRWMIYHDGNLVYSKGGYVPADMYHLCGNAQQEASGV